MHAQFKSITHKRQSPSLYYWIIGSLCLLYLAIQLGFISYEKLTVDDLWLSYHTYQFKSLLPYRDFSPYKTALGYYILLIPLQLFHGVIMPLLCTKAFMAFINAVCLSLSAIWMKRFFAAPAIIFSVLLLLFSQFFLNYSAEIRVDMLAYWLCLFSILCILEKQFLLAGIVSGLSFAISQKALWYVIATNGALGACWIYQGGSLALLRQMIIYNLTTLMMIVLYIAFWSYYAGLHAVLHNVFYEAYLVFSIDSYNSGRLVLWQFILHNNSLYFMLLPLSVLSLVITPTNDSHRGLRFFITLLSLVIMFSIISYKQPFPYNVLVTFPAFLVLYAAFFSWLYAIFQQRILTMRPSSEAFAFCYLYLYLFGLVYLIHYFALPLSRLLICLIPITLIVHIMATQYRKPLFAIMLITTLFLGVTLPSYSFMKLLPELNGSYQKYVLNLTDVILAEGGDYVAGVPLFYNKNLPIPGLKHIVLPSLDYLYRPSAAMLPVMNLPSLYLTPDTTGQIITSLQNSSVKLYVNNERLNSVPPAIKEYLATQYQHYWGSIYLYAPLINSGKQTVKLKFAGTYRVDSKIPVILNNQAIQPGTLLKLAIEDYSSNAQEAYRLTWIPAINQELLRQEYKKDDWQQTLE